MSETSFLESLYNEDIYQFSSPILILISQEWSEVSEEEKGLLQKILGSVRVSPAMINILTRKEFTIDDLAAYGPQRIISFGSHYKSPANKYEHFKSGTTSIIIADALGALDDAKKKSLWMALKQMFSI